MATMSLSILGFYNWLQSQNEPELFRDLVIPETVDKDILVNNILMQAAPFEVVYSDPDVMRDLIGIWSNSRLEFWERVEDSWLKANEFNQLENFDRSEDETIENSGTDTSSNTQTRNLAGSDNRTVNLQDQDTRNLTDEHKVSAYDVSTYSTKDQDTHTGTDTVNSTGTDNHATTDTGTVADAGSFIHGHKIEREARFHGNIGVTSLAQLLEGYDAAAEKWDLYAIITQEFIKEFCVMVY